MKPNHDQLFQIASQQGGYFTAAQAHAVGISAYLLWYHVRRGRYERARAKRGLYRLRHYPSSPNEHVIEAWLAAGPHAVVSHDSALALHGLSDVVPSKVHLTLPRAARWLATRSRKRGIQVHTAAAPFKAHDVTTHEGVRVTAPARTILDAAQAGAAPEQVVLAIQQGVERGLVTARGLRAAAAQRSKRVRRLVERGLQGIAA